MVSSPPLDQAHLLELYKIAIDEYRFVVQFNWRRVQFFIVASAGVLSVGSGIVGQISYLDRSAETRLLLMALFLSGFLVSLLGIQVLVKGRRYYHRTVFKKMLVEQQLGLNSRIGADSHPANTLALATTKGMDTSETPLSYLLSHQTKWPIRFRSISGYVFVLLSSLALSHLLFAAVLALG